MSREPHPQRALALVRQSAALSLLICGPSACAGERSSAAPSEKASADVTGERLERVWGPVDRLNPRYIPTQTDAHGIEVEFKGEALSSCHYLKENHACRARGEVLFERVATGIPWGFGGPTAHHLHAGDAVVLVHQGSLWLFHRPSETTFELGRGELVAIPSLGALVRLEGGFDLYDVDPDGRSLRRVFTAPEDALNSQVVGVYYGDPLIATTLEGPRRTGAQIVWTQIDDPDERAPAPLRTTSHDLRPFFAHAALVEGSEVLAVTYPPPAVEDAETASVGSNGLSAVAWGGPVGASRICAINVQTGEVRVIGDYPCYEYRGAYDHVHCPAARWRGHDPSGASVSASIVVELAR